MGAPRVHALLTLAVGLVFAAAAQAQAQTAAPPLCAGRSLVAEVESSNPAALAAAVERARREFPNAEGLLWRISRAGVPDSALFGTMHATDTRALAFPEAVRAELRRARVVAVEQADLLRPGPAVDALGQKLVQLAIDPAGGTLGFLAPAPRTALERALSERGLPIEVAQRFRPWFLNVLLASPLCEQRRVSAGLINVDATIAQNRPAGTDLVSLETVDEQVAALSGLPDDVSRHALQWSVRHLARADDIYATLLNLYLSRRPIMLLDVAQAAGLVTEEDRVMQLRFIRALGELRDKVMAERALPLLARGGAFIAVGALHLPGKDGLVERFRRAGYTVTRLW